MGAQKGVSKKVAILESKAEAFLRGIGGVPGEEEFLKVCRKVMH